MDTVTYPHPTVAQFIQRHCVPVKLPVKEHPQLVSDFLATWTPNVVFIDGQGKVHYRVIGYLPPEDFTARLSLGIGRYRLNHGQPSEAGERFLEVSQRHRGTDEAAEALYWLGVSRYKESKDPKQLKASWEELAREHPRSTWARRTDIP